MSSFLSGLPRPVQDAFLNSDSTASRRVGLYDFYDFHVLTYCDGYYNQLPTSNETRVPPPGSKRDVVACSKQSSVFHTTLQQILLNDAYKLNNYSQGFLGIGLSDDDIDSLFAWPDGLEKSSADVQKYEKQLYYIYILAIVLLFLSLICFLSQIRSDHFLLAIFTSALISISLICLIAAGAVATILVRAEVNQINKYSAVTGITAIKGVAFMSVTWGAMGAALFAFLIAGLLIVRSVWHSVDRCCGKKHKKGPAYYDDSESRKASITEQRLFRGSKPTTPVAGYPQSGLPQPLGGRYYRAAQYDSYEDK